MSKVEFTLNNGRTVAIHPALADHLAKLKRGAYRTTAVQESPQRAVLVPAPVVAPVVREHAEEPAATFAVEPPAVDLASMSVEQLREYAKHQGVQVHHRAGAPTILEALKKAEE